MSGHLGGGGRHWGGVRSSTLQRQDRSTEFNVEWRARVEREQIQQWSAEAIVDGETPHYLVEVLIGVESGRYGETPEGYAMYVDADCQRGVERRVGIRRDPSAPKGYRLEDGAELPSVIGVDGDIGRALSQALRERYQTVLREAHGIGGGER